MLGRDKKRPTITGKGKKVTAKGSRRSTVTTNIGYSETGTNMEMQSMIKNWTFRVSEVEITLNSQLCRFDEKNSLVTVIKIVNIKLFDWFIKNIDLGLV